MRITRAGDRSEAQFSLKPSSKFKSGEGRGMDKVLAVYEFVVTRRSDPSLLDVRCTSFLSLRRSLRGSKVELSLGTRLRV